MCPHREQTVDGDTAIRPFIVIIPQQPQEATIWKERIKTPVQHVRDGYLPSEVMWKSRNANCRVQARRGEPQPATFVVTDYPFQRLTTHEWSLGL